MFSKMPMAKMGVEMKEKPGMERPSPKKVFGKKKAPRPADLMKAMQKGC